jgi:hypothetical protein
MAQYGMASGDDLAPAGIVKLTGSIAAGRWHRESLHRHEQSGGSAEGATAPETLRQKDRFQFDL